MANFSYTGDTEDFVGEGCSNFLIEAANSQLKVAGKIGGAKNVSTLAKKNRSNCCSGF